MTCRGLWYTGLLGFSGLGVKGLGSQVFWVSGSMLQAQDSKMAGEAATQPSVRLPPLREGRLPKLMQAALACRVQGEALPETDLAILLDGGREGSWVVEGSSHAICSLLS